MHVGYRQSLPIERQCYENVECFFASVKCNTLPVPSLEVYVDCIRASTVELVSQQDNTREQPIPRYDVLLNVARSLDVRHGLKLMITFQENLKHNYYSQICF